MRYMTAKEAAEKWNISQRRVAVLCAENRIENAEMLGNMWLIPKDAEKPQDARSLRYFENKKKEILLTINFLFDTMFITNQYIKMKEMFVR